MAKLSFDSLNYSRDAGMFTVTGKDYLEVATKLRAVDGIDGVEHDEENGEYVFTYNKVIIDQQGIKDLFKKLK